MGGEAGQGGGGLWDNVKPLTHGRSGEWPQDHGRGEKTSRFPSTDQWDHWSDSLHQTQSIHLTLEELNREEQVQVQGSDPWSTVAAVVTPIIRHCSVAIYWPVHQGRASALPSPAFQDGHAHYAGEPCLGAWRVRAALETAPCWTLWSSQLPSLAFGRQPTPLTWPQLLPTPLGFVFLESLTMRN